MQEYSAVPVHERIRLERRRHRRVIVESAPPKLFAFRALGGLSFSRPDADEDHMKPTCICGATDCCNVRESGHAFCAEHRSQEEAA